MIVLAIDPGTTHSAWLEYHPGAPRPVRSFCAHAPNEELLAGLAMSKFAGDPRRILVIERMVSYGMKPTGFDTFESVRWSGRFEQAYMLLGNAEWLTSPQVKKHLAVPTGGGDSGVMHALLDRWGGKRIAVGHKASPGPLYGVSSHAWRALGLAVVWSDLHPEA